MFQDSIRLYSDPVGTLSRLRQLGATRVRLYVTWEDIAPQPRSSRRPRGFRAADPKSYPARNWAIWDDVIRDAQADGIAIDLDVGGGAPLWATGKRKPPVQWEPSPGEFGAFVHAVGIRYSGTYDPNTHSSRPGDPNDLPAVRFWSIWNEPNLGFMLAPQGVPGKLTIENSPRMYRGLVDAAWTALQRTGHGKDSILIGELGPRGADQWGVFSSMKPLVFVRALYCVDSRYRELRGTAAALRGCPTTAAASRRFRQAHPGLFQATGFSDHLWNRWYAPNRDPQPDPDNSDLPEIGGLERALDRTQAVYRSSKRFPIWNTEFGYITDPPNHTTTFVSPATAAYYLNWAEYISWRNPRIASFEQYLLGDPTSTPRRYVAWSSGLLTFKGQEKPTYSAWRLPLYLPVSTARLGQSLEVWGCARPAHYASMDTGGEPQVVQIQFQQGSSGPFTTLASVTITDPHGYFDTHVSFPASGTVRLVWTYPDDDLMLAPGDTAYSRHVQVTVR